jgi:hypothetical protein
MAKSLVICIHLPLDLFFSSFVCLDSLCELNISYLTFLGVPILAFVLRSLDPISPVLSDDSIRDPCAHLRVVRVFLYDVRLYLLGAVVFITEVLGGALFTDSKLILGQT